VTSVVEQTDRAESTAVDAPLEAGTELAPGYRVLTHIVRGEALDVYEVFSDERLCSAIAKVVRPDRRHLERISVRLQHEGDVLRRLGHPHLVRCWEVLSEPQLTVVLETIPGLTLEEAIEERDRRLPAEELVHLGRHLCSALHYLHAHDVLHLDIRPANVMAQGGVVKLIDLSLAGSPGPGKRGRGTREYMAPEQAEGGTMSAATDVWGVGATLYEAATREPPFAPCDEDEGAVWEAGGYLQLRRRALPPRHWGRRLPRDLDALISACLTPDPQARPTVAEVYATLGRLLDDIAARAATRELAMGDIDDADDQLGAGTSRR
jgi:serine/threonine protein kinase